MADFRERIFKLMRFEASRTSSHAYTAYGVIRELDAHDHAVDETEYIPSAQVRADLTALVRDGVVESHQEGRNRYYIIGIETRKYSWDDLMLFQKYFPKAFRPILKKQNYPGGGDALLSYIERARREEARQNGESYAGLGGLGGIVSRSGIFGR